MSIKSATHESTPPLGAACVQRDPEWRAAVAVARTFRLVRLTAGVTAIRGHVAATLFVLWLALLLGPSLAAAQAVGVRAAEIEVSLNAFPKRSLTELAALARDADSATASERRFVYLLYGQAMVASGMNADAVAFAERMERDARSRADELWLATAQLVHGRVESQSGDQRKANAFA